MPRCVTRSESKKAPQHPGPYVREAYLEPVQMSVTAAARSLGVSRPAASNFLNANAAASPEMAARLERVFGVPAKTILDMQAAFDAGQAKSSPSGAQSFVPPFLAITANQIETWADQTITARQRLSVLLRTLVHSTGIGLTAVEFSGNDDSERSGWDGRVKAGEGTPWIPAGQSGWEFGVTANIKGKADGDFAKSLKATPEGERRAMTFVFVTPRRWHGKSAWVEDAKAKGKWRDVRAYDASDIEQWLEQSLPGQVWLANELGTDADKIRSLDQCWLDWANVAHPILSPVLFEPAIESAKQVFSNRLATAPDRPLVVEGDSSEEALAFLASLFAAAGRTDLEAARDRVMVFDRPGVLPRLARTTQRFIAVATTREVERELATITKTMHCVIVCPRNTTNTEPDIILVPIGYDTFQKGLEAMGLKRDEINRLDQASGRSLTVLRRRLATVDAVKTPGWAATHKTAQALVPMMLVGTWNAANSADQEGLSLIAERPYAEMERDCQQLVPVNDPPLWSIAHFRGAISKIDLLYAIAPAVTRADLERYFSLARLVLGEDDPALDLDENDRWFAAMRGKVREFSSAFRRGISETLVLLAVHGNALFQARLGINCAYQTEQVVRALLPFPLTGRVLEANDSDLPTYAEAAPDAFLEVVEEDLKCLEPAVLSLMRPAGPGPFTSPSRTGLLWALEGLAWNPATLTRTARILARLAQVEITDNWINKPINSLESIFRAWMPQTAADHDARLNVMQDLAKRFKSVAWKLCISQFSFRNEVGHHSHKPRWRPDGFGFGEPIGLQEPIWRFQRAMVDMALTWTPQILSTLNDLVDCVEALANEHQAEVWTLVKKWAETASDDEKAILREKIRVTTFSYRALRRAGKRGQVGPVSAAVAKQAYAALRPSEILSRVDWLFKKHWVEESYDELHEDEELNFEKRQERVSALRVEALKEVFSERGISGLIDLSLRGEAGHVVGWLSAKHVLPPAGLVDMIETALEAIDRPTGSSARMIVSGVLVALDDQARAAMLRCTFNTKTELERAQLLMMAPFATATWGLVDDLRDDGRAEYWRKVGATWLTREEDSAEAVTRLLDARRPRAAFSCVNHHLERISDLLLFRVLEMIAQGGDERDGEYMLEDYAVGQAFKLIDRSQNLSVDQKAWLEFAFVKALTGPGQEHGTPSLDRYVEDHPEFYVRAVVWTYKRHHNGEDPPEYHIPEDRRSGLALHGHHFLEHFKRIPGVHEIGAVDSERLQRWVSAVRAQAAELDRAEIADHAMGKLFASAPTGPDDVWPCDAVRDVMESVASEEMMAGARVGRYNARGVHSSGEGGGAERDIADRYRVWAEALQISHPFITTYLLMGLVRTYEEEARREDNEVGIRRRLR